MASGPNAQGCRNFQMVWCRSFQDACPLGWRLCHFYVLVLECRGMCDTEGRAIVRTLLGSSRAALIFTVLPTKRAPFKYVNVPTSACQLFQ